MRLEGTVTSKALRCGKEFSTISVEDPRFPLSTQEVVVEASLTLGRRYAIIIQESQ